MAQFRERSRWNYTTKRGGDERYQTRRALVLHAPKNALPIKSPLSIYVVHELIRLGLAVAVTAQEHPVRCLHGIYRQLAHHGDGDRHLQECHGFYVAAINFPTVCSVVKLDLGPLGGALDPSRAESEAMMPRDLFFPARSGGGSRRPRNFTTLDFRSDLD